MQEDTFMINCNLKLPAFALHETFNIGTIDIKVITDVWDARCVRFLALFGYDASRFHFRGCNDKGVGYRCSFESLLFADQILEMWDFKNLTDKIHFILTRYEEYTFVFFDPFC